MPKPSQIAQLIPQSGGAPITVHFNPTSLSYTLEAKSSQKAANPKKVQHVAEISGKLSMDLQFDSTDTGDDVRIATAAIARLLQPSADATQKPSAKNSTAPPVVQFSWGSYQFNGMLDSFKETIDLFSDDGVALRALVSITLSQQDVVYDDSLGLSPTDTSGSLIPTSSAPGSPSGSPQSLATSGGDPSAARQLASDNGLDSMRFTGGAVLQVNVSAQLNPPTAFVTASASASASFGISASASASIGGGIGIGGGVGIGASAGIGIGGGVSVGAGAGVSIGGGALFGAKASAGVLATAGAFAGLQTGRAVVSTTAQLDPSKMMPASVAVDVSTDSSASFSLGGAAQSSSSAGFSADVGANLSLSDRMSFDSD